MSSKSRWLIASHNVQNISHWKNSESTTTAYTAKASYRIRLDTGKIESRGECINIAQHENILSLCSKNISNEVREKNYLNTASALIKQSIHEMEIFVEHLNGKKDTVRGLAGLGDLYVSSGGGRNAKMGFYIGEGLTFSEAKKTKMEKVTVEGADLAKEIAKKVNSDFDQKKLPLMLGMINAIVDDKKLELDWEAFR